MLSWPSPYILPDSPRRQQAQHAVNNAHAPTRIHKHADMYFISHCVAFRSETLAQTLSETLT